MWLLPEGELLVGDPQEDNASPVFSAEVEAIYLSKAPITNLQFEVFDSSYVRSPVSPGDDMPAVGISYHRARAYCAWWTEMTGRHFRLPTEVEWEFACRAGTRERWYFEPDVADDHLWDQSHSTGGCGSQRVSRFQDFTYHDVPASARIFFFARLGEVLRNPNVTSVELIFMRLGRIPRTAELVWASWARGP